MMATEHVLYDIVWTSAASLPGGLAYTRASAATTIHPSVSSPAASGFTTNVARIVTTTAARAALLFEGAATNGHASDTPWDAATWTGAPLAGSTTTQDAVTLDPAGVAGCALHAVLSGGYGRYDSAAAFYAADILGQLITVHHYTKGAAAAVYGSNAYDGTLGHGAIATLTGAWDHQAATYIAAGRVRSVVVADGRDESATGGATAGARNYRSARHMIETGPRASSWIAAASTRAGGRLRTTSAGSFVVDGRLCVEWTFEALHDCTVLPWSPRLWTFDADNYAEIDRAARCIRVVVDGAAYWVSAPITWSRGDLVVLRLDVGNGPTTGTVQVAGGRVCAINDGRTLASLPSSGTLDIGSSNATLQLEGAHVRTRFFTESPAYRTVVVSDVATLTAAVASARGRTRILLRAGVYRLTSALTLTAANNGIAIAPYPGETATIDGGEVISGPWSAPDGEGVQSAAFTGHSLQLWADGVACERAKSGEDPAGWSWNGDGTVTAPSGAEAAKVGLDGWIVSRRLWRTFRMRVSLIVGAVITLNANDYADATTQDPLFSPNAVWWAEGLGYVGDADGHFWHDRANDTLYYKPRAGQDLTTDEVVAGKIERLLMVLGSLDTPVRDITISGIEFRHSTWTDPDDHGATVLQGSIMVRSVTGDDAGSGYLKIPGAIVARTADRFVLTGCTIAGIGSDGVSFRYGTHSSAVLDCVIDDIAATGLSIGNITAFVEDPHPSDVRQVLGENVHANNLITNVATLYTSGHAIWAVYVRGYVCSNNRIGPTPYTPIAINWSWGANDLGGVLYLGSPSGWPLGVTPAPATETYAGRILIAGNYLEGYLERLDDGGGIYTISDLGNGGRSVIVDNYVLESSAAANQSAIYLDQASEHIDVRHNVFDNQSAWAKVQGSVIPYAINNTLIGNYADGGAYGGPLGNVQESNTVGTLGATALAIKAAAGRK